jgi:hypothetical protein
MSHTFYEYTFYEETRNLPQQRFYKQENIILSPQDAIVKTNESDKIIKKILLITF